MRILYVNGCEISAKTLYIDNKKTEIPKTWAENIGKMLNFDNVVNHSAQHGSNDRILRMSFEWFADNMDEHDIFAIIQPTEIARREFYSYYAGTENCRDGRWIRFFPGSHKMYKENKNEINFLRLYEDHFMHDIESQSRGLGQILSLQMFMETYNIKYRFIGNDHCNTDTFNDCGLKNMIEWNSWITVSKKYTHEDISDRIYEEIKEKICVFT